jgi:hypothetical protein
VKGKKERQEKKKINERQTKKKPKAEKKTKHAAFLGFC